MNRPLPNPDEIAGLLPADPAVRRLLREAADENRPEADRRADWRLLGALAGRAFVGPRLVILDVVGRCNLNCVYCRDHSPYIQGREAWRDEEMPFDLARRLIDETAALGAEQLTVVGAGENLCHTRFVDLVAALKAAPLRFEMATNGLGWTAEVVDLFADAAAAQINFSLSAATAETWAAFRPEMAPELFAPIEASIAALARRPGGPRVGIIHVLNKRNVREVLPMIRRAIELGADEVQYKLTEINEAARPLRLDAPEIESIRLEIREARRLAALAGVAIHDNIEFQLDHVEPESGLYTRGLYDRWPCFAGLEMLRIRRDGAISFCCGLKFLGDARRQSLADYWYGPESAAARRAALDFPRGGDLTLPAGNRLRDDECDYCYNYILNDQYRRRALAAGVWDALLERA